MPTRMHTDHPFATPAPPTQAELLAYLEGRLSPERAHAVERSMELDPLVREAVDGLRESGATSALQELDHLRPNPRGGGGKQRWFVIGALVGMGLVAGIWLALPLFQKRIPTAPSPLTQQPIAPLAGAQYDEALRMDPAEINTAEEQPETLRIGHRATERPVPNPEARTALVREPAPLPIDPLRLRPAATTPDPAKPVRAARSTRMLLFPHDLKMVHPEEFYPYEPGVVTEAQSVSAAYPDRKAQQTSTEKQRTMIYTVYMERALGEFSRADHRTCLKSLNFLLEQYPNDVNALFYAGLCSYNLALYDRARQFLHRAATHPVDSFFEEATWYHALTLERLGEREAAQEAFARIAAEQGFYAERANERIR